MIKFRCAHCQQKLGVPDEYAGRRIRCSKCSQPNVVPSSRAAAEPAGEPQAVSAGGVHETGGATPPADADGPSIQLDFQTAPPESAAADVFSDLAGMDIVQEAPDFEAIRAARQETAAKRAPAGRSAGKAGAAKPTDSGREPTERAPIADMVPGVLHLPLAVTLGVAAVVGMTVLWIVCARATSRPLGIFALVVAGAGACGMRVFVVNRTMLWGMLGTALAAVAILGGKAAVAKYVVIPIYEKEANRECLAELDALLKDEKLQLPQSSSAKVYATDGDFLMCIALVSLVDDDQADPVQVRAWALHILRVSNKTNIFAFLADAGTHTYESKEPELDAEGEAVFGKARQRMFEWEENETALRNVRKYFPALARLANQCELLRILENPQRTFTLALIDTVGLFDIVWILLGLGLAYIALALD